MTRLRFILQPEGDAFDVDEAALVGACASQLASLRGYPLSDSAGRQVVYSLRLASRGNVLPNARRFRDLGLAQGTHLTLIAAAASAATIPVQSLGLQGSAIQARTERRQWSRRSVLAGVVAACALAGFGSGLTAALAQHYLGRRGRVATAPVTPTSAPAPLKRILSASRASMFTEHEQTVRAVSWSPDGQLLASAGDDAQLLVWGIDGLVRQRIPHPSAVNALAWSPESTRIVSGAANPVTFFTVLAATTLASFSHEHAAPVTSLAWSAHGQQQVVSGAQDQRAVVWETVAAYRPQIVFTRHTAPIESVSWAADGQTVGSSSHGGVVRVWNAENGQERHPFYQDAPLPMRAAAFAPIGMALAVGGDDGGIRLWDGLLCQAIGMSGAGQICQDPPLRLHVLQSPVRALSWSPDGRYLASGSADGTFSLWDLAQAQAPIFTMQVQPGSPVYSLSWAPTGNQLATASGQAVVIWNLHA